MTGNDTNDTPATSADQDAWVELAVILRERLRHYAEVRLPIMTIDEVKTLVDAIEDAQWGHIRALSFDAIVERNQKPFD